MSLPVSDANLNKHGRPHDAKRTCQRVFHRYPRYVAKIFTKPSPGRNFPESSLSVNPDLSSPRSVATSGLPMEVTVGQ